MTETVSVVSVGSIRSIKRLMNDNINSRYRQLEMPMRKEDPVTAQYRKSEQLIRLTRHVDDC
jgi:hypothetical protein